MSIYSTRKSKNHKNGPNGTPKPASASPWRAKRGTLPKLSTFLSQLKGGLWRKNKYSKKVNAEKLKGDPLGFLNAQSVVKYQRNWRGDPLERKNFQKKSLTMPKNWKPGHFGVFHHPFCRKTSENWRGEIFYFRKKISQCRNNWKGGPFGIFQHPFCRKTAKKLKGTLWSRPVWYVTREKNQSRMCGKGVGLGLFPSEVEKWPFFWPFLGYFWLCFSHPSHTILMPLHI